MKNNVCNFLKFYKDVFDKDIDKQINEELVERQNRVKEIHKIEKKIDSLKESMSKLSYVEKQNALETIRRLDFIKQSTIIEENSKEEIQEKLEEKIYTKLAPLLEEIIYLLKVEEMLK